MAKIRRIDFSPDEWIAGCLGLSVEEEGLYIRICALIWSRGGRITDDLLKASCNAHGNKVNALLAGLERKGKIVRNGSEIGQKRAENELEKAEERHRNASENASKRWKTNGIANAEASQPSIANHQPSTTNHQPEKETDAIASSKKGAANGAGARGSRLAATWRPCLEDREFAEGLGLDADAVGDQFRDYWIGRSGSGATKLDWCATWRNWCRRAVEGNGAKRNGQGDSVTIAAIRRLNF